MAVKKRSPDVLLGISLYSEDNPETARPYYDSLYLSNYATIQVKDAIARVEGVGDVAILVEKDGFVEAAAPGIVAGERAVHIGAADFGACGNGSGNSPPRSPIATCRA